ncbi:MAG: hypothetical protein AB1452_12385 [Pseudomonadota bacterium]
MSWLAAAWARCRALLAPRGSGVRSVAQLEQLLQRHAAFIAQKCADDYCRNKVGLSHYALGEEQTYRDAMNLCRLEGFAAVLAGLTVVTQRALLEAGFDAERIERALAALYGRVLARHPIPAHRPQGWGDLVAALPARLRAARTDPPPPLAEIVAPVGRRLFEVLPIHARYREFDEPVVVGAVHFNFVGFSDRLRRELDAEAVGRELAAAG